MLTSEDYISNEFRRFRLVKAEEWHDPKYNSNIDPRQFDPEFNMNYNTEERNELYTSWRRRILMETTPHGLVYMYYNTNLNAFSYISQASISNPILNACAMKYVRVFFCRSLFDDDRLLPEGTINRMGKLQHDIDMLIKNQNKEPVRAYLGGRIVVNTQVTDRRKPLPKRVQTIEYRTNIFNHVSRSMVDAYILQPVKKQQSVHVKEISVADFIKKKREENFNLHKESKFEESESKSEESKSEESESESKSEESKSDESESDESESEESESESDESESDFIPQQPWGDYESQYNEFKEKKRKINSEKLNTSIP
jgi:hypothetical protein